ncbi:hypothetical protein I4U23_024380 [Adineta vaga]|nr:hypothetical protein I4U23_024380 [Adineta vaga]
MGNLQGKDRSLKYLHSTNSSTKNDHIDQLADRPFVVVWCDASIGSDANANDDVNTLIQLTSIVNRKRQLIHTFSEIDACQEFILHANNICLIVSGQMGTQLVPSIHDLRQVHSIYIFCLNKSKYDQWAKKYDKVRGVYTEIDEICDYLKKYFMVQSVASDYEQLQVNALKKNIELPSIDKQETAFLHAILTKSILSNINLIKIEDMINYCRVEYPGEYQQQTITDLEKDYSQHDPIWWFTRDNFLQKIVNRALQINDLFTLCTMSPFIQQLIQQLTQLHGEQISSLSKGLELYSCQSMSYEDFEKVKLNQGGLMCINQFLFANSEQAVPMNFIQHQVKPTGNTGNINVLLNISIVRVNEPNVSFANIGTKSQFVHENEYLISMSSIYRIDKIEQLPQISSAWLIYLTLIDKKDTQFTQLTDYLKSNNSMDESNLPELATSTTHKLYQFKSTRKLFEQSLQTKTKQTQSILLHYNMGVIYDCMSQYQNAVSDYKSAIDLVRQTIPNGYHRDDLCLIPLYSNMGLSYERLNIFPHAFDHAYRALSILSRTDDSVMFKKELSASTYFNLGLIHELDMKFAEAKMFYEQALKNRLQFLSNEHPDVISLRNTLKLLAPE